MNYNLFEDMPDDKMKEKTATMVNILGVEAKETYITKWFAYLISPNTFNDFRILRIILELYNEIARPEENIKVDSFSNVEVNTEVLLSDFGIIDILITMDECIIGIENKIYSGLGVNQLQRYSKALDGYEFKWNYYCHNKQNRLPIVKILLTPKSNAAKQTNGFIKITYEEIVDRIDNLGKNWSGNDRKSIYLSDFITYIDEYLREERKVVSKEWTSFLVQNYKDLNTIYDQGVVALDSITESIEKRIGKMNATDDEQLWSIGNTRKGTGENGFWIQAYYSDWNAHKVHYEFIFPEATKGFLIPKELVLNLDIELVESRNKLRKIGFGDKKNEISTKLINPNDISLSLDELFKELEKWHKKNYAKIDAQLKKSI